MKILCFLFMIFCFEAAKADVLVVDGDSLRIGATDIRLKGIDSPEYNQYCFDKNKNKYNCGTMATKYLQELISNKEVDCVEHSKDRYKRSLCTCYVLNKDGAKEFSINAQMVKSGWAVAYMAGKKDYEVYQKKAIKQKRGMWQGKFMKPELFRALNR